MSSAVCSHCGCSDIDVDSTRGDAVCTGCGSVLEDQIIVSEVQFQDNAMGGSSVIGQYVSSEGGKCINLGSGFHHGIAKESRLVTLQNAKRRIQVLGAQLKLNQHCIDIAFNFFKMALNKRLTRGRKTAYVVGACLYMVCRTEGTPHMLLDFSDVLQVNVYNLGRTYLQLSRELCINAPALDPCLYIHRFAHKLEFGEKTHEVSMAALRLVSRMKRDWMAQGRRPSGLCGAALLVAARIHNFSRTIKEIIKVVKIGEGTIRKRLAEFEQTPSSSLTIDEFHRIDLEEEMDPPCFTEGKKKAKTTKVDERTQLQQWTSEVSLLQCQIENALEKAAVKRTKRIEDGDGASVCSSVSSLDDFDSSLDQLIKREQSRTAGDVKLDVAAIKTDGATAATAAESRGGGETDVDPDVARLEKVELDSVLMPPPMSEGGVGYGPRPTAASLGLKESIEECMKPTPPPTDEDEDGELDMTGIDDEEINKLILSKEEVERKTRLWLLANADYLKEQKVKEEKEAKDRELGLDKPETKKKRRQTKKKTVKTEASSAGEAIEKMLQEKKISCKINYDVLKGLKGADGGGGGGGGGAAASVLGVGPLVATPVILRSPLDGRFKRPAVLPEKSSLPMGKRVKREEAEVKPQKMEREEEEEKPVVRPIVESGPVQYASHDEAMRQGAVEEEEEEEEEEGDEEPLLSAASLMGHVGTEEYVEDGYDNDMD